MRLFIAGSCFIGAADGTTFLLAKMACLAVKISRAAFVKLESRFGLAVIDRNTIIRDNSAPIYRATAALYCNGEKLIGLACSVVLSQGLFRSLSLFRVPGGSFTAIMNGCDKYHEWLA